MTAESLAALWGAALSTVLAIVQGVGALRRRARVQVSAGILFDQVRTDEPQGPVLDDPEKGKRLVRLRVVVANAGGSRLQVGSLYFEYRTQIAQVRPEVCPLILEPQTSYEFNIQKEWLDLGELREFGVVDGLGRRHPVEKKLLADLIGQSKSLPTTVKPYKRKDGGQTVTAFQVQDRGILLPRRTDRSQDGDVR